MDIKIRCDKVRVILQKTHDGNDLSQKDLKIVEMAVNGHLNDEGWKYFDDLYKKYELEGTQNKIT